MISPFTFAGTPELHFGNGKLSILPTLIKNFGSKILLVTGARSFLTSAAGKSLVAQLESQYQVEYYSIEKEPTPVMIDTAVQQCKNFAPDVVVAIGGGSVLDAGKAISAMLIIQEPVKDYLEGVGKKTHPGKKVPFIAVPTTSGTGSEATKNAVLSEVGPNGYKRSLRHNNFTPNAVVIDPSLSISCSPFTTATSGMDAFTQLLESYLSTAANPMTDAYALEGLKLVSRSLIKAYSNNGNLEARADMSLGAYLSGVTLANAGLGLVHGFASPIGGFFDIPHGVICSSLMAPCNKITVRKLRLDGNTSALSKYATAGKIFSADENKSDDYYIDNFIGLLESWTKQLSIPSLKQFISSTDFSRIIEVTDNKKNPVKLTKNEMLEILVLA